MKIVGFRVLQGICHSVSLVGKSVASSELKREESTREGCNARMSAAQARGRDTHREEI